MVSRWASRLNSMTLSDGLSAALPVSRDDAVVGHSVIHPGYQSIAEHHLTPLSASTSTDYAGKGRIGRSSVMRLKQGLRTGRRRIRGPPESRCRDSQ